MSETQPVHAHPINAHTVVRSAPLSDERPSPSLSSREIEVLLAWILSDTKSDVGRRLFIAPGTVNTHIGRIREKYSRAGRPAPTKAALLARALQDGYISLDDI
ncbi:LuxR C-terminal-related transcriptional regulator [Nocardia nova]|uniref:LuxR C-terminal-related transcriptional regulator n=1 Tax=Nocardia nova TaxID=37330 RepID=UPI001C49332A|nr:LuxR C-terminal-related transcriptional regulator [Nocardia nova]MBV7703970.1 LuxR C-terminal-related transcriptional regulator [Nocardia nova]